MLARNDALEQQLEEAQEALAEKQRELDAATNPPETTVESDEPPPRPTSADKRKPNTDAVDDDTKQRGIELAAQFISDDGTTAKRAKGELRQAGPVTTDAAAKALASRLRRGGPEADAVCRALKQKDGPSFGGKGYSKLFRAFMKLTKRNDNPLATAAMQAFISRGVSKAYQRRKESAKARRASTGAIRRVLSVFTRAWVIVVFGFPALIGVILFVSTPGARLYTVVGLGALALFVVIVDSYKRRCPKCRKLLAGALLSMVSDNYGGHILSWSCAFCKRRWKTGSRKSDRL